MLIVNYSLNGKQETIVFPTNCTSLKRQAEYVQKYFENEGFELSIENIKSNPALRQ